MNSKTLNNIFNIIYLYTRVVQYLIFFLRPGFGDKKNCDLIMQNKILMCT